ncbi:hypothetical protein [Brevibacillus dissolubilis]|uniref:hypothetical protein n=1 Tax=Brevibacillus dissolubilis TaxID=1844116 RepID=UPI00159B8F02|nr:hypothetical protein [Brevibacillus dissolubilis]
MKFAFGQKVAVKTKGLGVEFIYPQMGMVLAETDTDLTLLFPDGRVTVSKSDVL